MIMKLFKRLSFLTFIAAATLATACNDIDSDDRFIELPAVEAKRVVLLEEFTGQMCVNCPTAHKVIENLVGQYPDNLICVSIHAGGSAFSIGEDELPGIVGLRIPQGETYAAAAGVNSFPCGVVNRKSGVQTHQQWADLIREAIQQPSHVDLNVEARIDGSNIEITTDIEPYENIDGFLQLWVVESGIQAMQMLPSGGLDMEYVHNHVFRAAVNGGDGEAVSLVIREPFKTTNTIALKPNWKVENLSIVAFVYTRDGGVEQAAQTSLITNDQLRMTN